MARVTTSWLVPRTERRGGPVTHAPGPRAGPRATAAPVPTRRTTLGPRPGDAPRRRPAPVPGPAGARASGHEPGYNAPTTRDGGARLSYPGHEPGYNAPTATLPR
ncbi:MAG: hypothetical protein IRZ31_20095, partial [Thermogemmatispora sp.]|nr:hypothetical protein [Thermogemmatispora sp.]